MDFKKQDKKIDEYLEKGYIIIERPLRDRTIGGPVFMENERRRISISASGEVLDWIKESAEDDL